MGGLRAELPRLRSLMVASTGGHLSELIKLADHLPLKGDPLWVTFDTPQSRAELAGRDVEFVPFVAPRDLAAVVRNVVRARDILGRHRVAELYSTGSGIALSFFPLARTAQIPCHYIESAARLEGPSLSGKLLGLVPGTRRYTQYEEWAAGRWHTSGFSVFDPYESNTPTEPTAPTSVFVALGTMPHRFDRMVEAVSRAVPHDWSITWQTGPNHYAGLRGRVHGLMNSDDFAASVARADVIIAHAGVGTALAALDAGKHPILVARRRSEDEHVDDHQRLIAVELASRGLAFHIKPEWLTTDLMHRAASVRVHTAPALAG